MLQVCSTDYDRCFFYSVLIGITKEAAIYNKQVFSIIAINS